jgi:tight adherence protein C
MSNTLRAVVAVSGLHAAIRFKPAWPWWTRLVPAAAVWMPVPALIGGTLLLSVRRVRSARASRRRSAEADADVVVLAELTALGLAGGLDPATALRGAAERVAPELRREVLKVLRRARTLGLADALASASGRAERFYRLIARAVDTGAPVRAAVESFVDEAADEDRARNLTEARRLPVKLLFPLALLILPGFMVLTIGPAVLSSLRRLGL